MWLRSLCISCLEMLFILWFLIVLGLGVLEAWHLRLLCTLWLCAWNILLKLFLMVTIPVLLYIFANGPIWSPSTFLCLWCCGSTGGCLLMDLWLYLNRGFEVIAGGIGQAFLNSNKFPDIFPASGHGVPA